MSVKRRPVSTEFDHFRAGTVKSHVVQVACIESLHFA
jgi:hypothetical protein